MLTVCLEIGDAARVFAPDDIPQFYRRDGVKLLYDLAVFYIDECNFVIEIAENIKLWQRVRALNFY